MVLYAQSTSTIIIISPERSEEYEVYRMRKEFNVSVDILAQLQDPWICQLYGILGGQPLRINKS